MANSSTKPSPSSPQVQSFMAAASASLGRALPAPKDVFGFGEPDARVSDQLLELAVSGAKTATTSWPVPSPRHWDVGDLSVVLDGANRPAALMRTLALHECRFADVPLDYALAEAEGDYRQYRDGHIAFYRRTAERDGQKFGDDSLVLCEKFEIIYSKRYATTEKDRGADGPSDV